MPLQFDFFEDKPLANTPLREVICQVRFPVILRISEEIPSDFQERIRGNFPELEVERFLEIETKQLLPGAQLDLKAPIFRFKDSSGKTAVSLAPDFFSLHTEDYETWPRFADDLQSVSDAVQEVYDIAYATRIGLRYVNFIDTSYLESDNFDDVYDIIRPELTALYRTEAVQMPFESLCHLRTDVDGSKFTLRYGVTSAPDNKRPGFLLDFDHYSEGKLELQDLVERCTRYHEVIYNAFRWSVSQEMLHVFSPLEPEGGQV